MTDPAEVPVPYFPGVRFFEGRCTLEHGDVAYRFAAVDSARQVFLLDSPSGFNFLIALHQPVGVDSSTVIDYTRLGCVFSGKLPGNARLIRRAGELPDSLRSRVHVKNAGVSRAAVSRTDLWEVHLSAFDDKAVYWTIPVPVSLPSGRLACVVDVWREPGHSVR